MNRHGVAALCGLLLGVVPVLLAQTRFVDDAHRSVQLPSRVNRVFAAGAPAEVLLYTLVPEKLVGRNRMPAASALDLYPPAYRASVAIRQLPDRDDPASDADLLALRPDVYIDGSG